ncbi:MAG: hypothetical protein JJE07_08945 [Flavobacteriaceae bacterium]|nr:hypothetical protein [Flavobacteriaceae bacterium]
MQDQYIQFKKQRELGEIISVTFKFLRENYKTLIKSITQVVGPTFILLIAALAYYTYTVAGSPLAAMEGKSEEFLISFFILAVTLLLFYASLYGTILHYIKSYIENNGTVDEAEIKTGAQDDLGKLFMVFIISAVIVFTGLILFIIPGIYLMVPLSLAATVLVFNKMSLGDSISHGFSLVKDHWWTTFFSIVVIWLLVYVIGLVFQLPLIIYTFMKMFAVAQEGSLADPVSYSDWVFILLNVISSVIQYLLSSIFVIALAFIYFNLNEHKNLTGTYETIDKLGD